MASPLDERFFIAYQKQLLGALNIPILGMIMRRLLGISGTKPIVKITPSAVHERLGERTFRATLYSNKQYQEYLHKSFSWIWNAIHVWDIQVANRFQPAWNLGFDTYSSQPDGTAGLDSYLDSANPTVNYGTTDFIATGERNDLTGQLWRTWIKFDLTSIPSGATSSSRTFSLWVRGDYSSNARAVNVYRCKRTVVEAEVTWNVYSSGNSWQTAGASGANDRESTDVLSLSVGSAATGEQQWTTGTSPSLIDAMFGSSPTFTNNGFILHTATETDDGYLWNSSDYATAGQRPKLTIVYTTPSNFFNFF